MMILNDTYSVLCFLGKNSVSTLFTVRHIRTNRLCTLKGLIKDRCSDLVIQEINTMSELSHPCLPAIWDIFEDDKLIYVVTEYVAGEDLRHFSKRGNIITEKMIISWFIELAQLLRYLHSQSEPVYAGDISPYDIIVQPDGTLKLLNTYVTKGFHKSYDMETEPVNDIGFTAPEQLESGITDERTDIYLLGMSMYCAATGTDPEEADRGYIPADLKNPQISALLSGVFEKCMRRDPRERYRSADELLRDLYMIDSRKYD